MLKPFGDGKQKSNLSLKIIGLQKLWTNEKISSSLSMKKWDKNCILHSQPGLFFIRKTYLTYKLSQLPYFVKVWSINHIIPRVSRFFWRR